MTYLRWWSGLLGAIAGFVLVPASTASAGHCSYCNEGLPTGVTIKTPEIGSDGVIVVVLDDERLRVLDQASWDITTVTVTDAMGVPVEGTLEIDPELAPAAWRPTNPWVPGIHHISVAVDLPAFGVGTGTCQPYTHEADVIVHEAPLHVVGSQELTVAETYALDPTRSPNTLVCCDGALPYKTSVPGILCPGYPSTMLEIGRGYCTERVGTGRLLLDAEISIDGAPLPPDYALREVTREQTTASGSGFMRVGLTAPACLEFEVRDLVTGERTVHISCHGEGLAEPLGTVEIDPTAVLAANCADVAYVCEVRSDDSWDPEACTTWPEGDPFEHPSLLPADDTLGEDDDPMVDDTSSGGCRVAPLPAGGVSGLGALLLGLLGLRRRSRAGGRRLTRRHRPAR